MHLISLNFFPLQDSEGQGIITDRGVQSICPVPGDPHVSKLENLVLTNTSITEKSVERLLKQMPSLKLLDLRGSKIADENIEALLVLRPGCKVIFDRSEAWKLFTRTDRVNFDLRITVTVELIRRLDNFFAKFETVVLNFSFKFENTFDNILTKHNFTVHW